MFTIQYPSFIIFQFPLLKQSDLCTMQILDIAKIIAFCLFLPDILQKKLLKLLNFLFDMLFQINRDYLMT